MFAAALHLAATGEDSRRRVDDAAAPLSGPAPLASPGAPDATQAAAPAVDLSDRRWPAQMIDRIEAMRDDADATSTRVRFAPDALGPVDVHVRRDGASVHLHFTAAQEGTRALLQDARPELARLAAERGLKLGDSSVGGGDAQPQRRPATPTPARFAAPIRAATADAADAAADIRIA